ncbi:hypothetical protein L3Q82_017293, partial [Scortum barcoo]
NPLGSHVHAQMPLGVKGTMFMIRQHFCWLAMEKEVSKYMVAYPVCARNQTSPLSGPNRPATPTACSSTSMVPHLRGLYDQSATFQRWN